MSKPTSSIKKIFSLLKNDLSKNHSSYIFFVTSKCNQACKFCFYSGNINKSVDLNLNEIKLLSAKMGGISNLLLSGGEPILRKDLLDIIDIFVKNNHIKGMTLPSNGMNKDLLYAITKQILCKYPELYLQVCISLDGPKEIHDKMRGVSNAFEKAVESIKVIEDLAMHNEKLSFNINTVISPENVAAIKGIIQEIKNLNISCYTHSFEIVRPDNITKKLEFKELEALKSAYNTILKYKDELYLSRLKYNIFKRLICGALQYANIYTLYRIQFDFTAKGRGWPMPCCAGSDNNVIYNNGDLSICELREPFANLKEISINENLREIFERQKAATKSCFCTHLCYILLSMYKSKKIILWWMPLSMIKYFFVRLNIVRYF